MPAHVTAKIPTDGEATFRDRGLGRAQGRRLVLTVCPHCFQRNDKRTAEKGYCQWCAYVSSLGDAEPAKAA